MPHRIVGLIVTLVLALLTVPLLTAAQQVQQVRRIGVIWVTSPLWGHFQRPDRSPHKGRVVDTTGDKCAG